MAVGEGEDPLSCARGGQGGELGAGGLWPVIGGDHCPE